MVRAMCAVLEEGSGFKCNDGDPFGRREWEGTKQDLCPRTQHLEGSGRVSKWDHPVIIHTILGQRVWG